MGRASLFRVSHQSDYLSNQSLKKTAMERSKVTSINPKTAVPKKNLQPVKDYRPKAKKARGEKKRLGWRQER
jgi:hypothetical protein